MKITCCLSIALLLLTMSCDDDTTPDNCLKGKVLGVQEGCFINSSDPNEGVDYLPYKILILGKKGVDIPDTISTATLPEAYRHVGAELYFEVTQPDKYSLNCDGLWSRYRHFELTHVGAHDCSTNI